MVRTGLGLGWPWSGMDIGSAGHGLVWPSACQSMGRAGRDLELQLVGLAMRWAYHGLVWLSLFSARAGLSMVWDGNWLDWP